MNCHSVLRVFEEDVEKKLKPEVLAVQFDNFAPSEDEVDEFPFAKIQIRDQIFLITKSDLLAFGHFISSSLALYEGISIHLGEKEDE